jgi:hypothetical protein
MTALPLLALLLLGPKLPSQGVVGTGAVTVGPPTLDSGSAFPLSNSNTGGTVETSIGRTGVTTAGAGLVVITVANNGSINDMVISSVTVGGNAATEINGMSWQAGQAYPGAAYAGVWAYWSTGALNNVTVTATHVNSSPDYTYEAITVWAYTAGSVKDGSSSVASCFGALGGKQQDASTTVDASLTGVLSTSVVVGAFMEGTSGGGLTALANTTWRASAQDGTFGASLRTGDASGQSGSITVGSSTSSAFMASAAAEVLAH